MGRPEVSVVVPVKDRRERMLRCVDALLAQDHPSFEIVVADNGSTDGTPEACRERAAGSGVPLRVEVLHGSVGAIRNRAAAEHATGEVVAFTDSDCLPEPGWLSAGVKPFADPAVGIVQGRTLPEVPPDRGWPATIEVTDYTGRFESCNILFRREAFAATPGFDERVGHFWEDTAAGFAMLRAGWRAAFAEDAVVRHDVTYPGFRWHLERGLKMENLAPVLAAYPEIRRELFFARVFFRARNAKLWAFYAGLALAPRAPRLALLLALPYARERLRTPWLWRTTVQTLLYDTSTVAGTVRGAIRERQLVL